MILLKIMLLDQFNSFVAAVIFGHVDIRMDGRFFIHPKSICALIYWLWINTYGNTINAVCAQKAKQQHKQLQQENNSNNTNKKNSINRNNENHKKNNNDDKINEKNKLNMAMKIQSQQGSIHSWVILFGVLLQGCLYLNLNPTFDSNDWDPFWMCFVLTLSLILSLFFSNSITMEINQQLEVGQI